MTPEEKAVINQALYLRYCIDAKTAGDPPRLGRLLDAVDALIYSCEECNAGGHTCPGDGNSIDHAATDCGEHQDDMPGTVIMPLAPELVTPVPPVKHAGEDGSCPDYGSTLDPCPPGCASGVCVANGMTQWVETTMANCLINDRIRIGAEETTVLRSNRGIWNVASRQAGWQDGAGNWRPEYVKGAAPWFPADRHVELRMELEAVPGFKQYPASASIELLCTPERLAVLRMQEGFPGSAITSSHVD